MPRPKLKPTTEQRRLVKSLSAFGVAQELIALKIGIRSAKSLRKYFRQELDQGTLEANAKVMQTLLQMATSGQHPAATFFWLKCRAGWRERSHFESTPTEPPPFVVAKEEGVQQP
jgi:hypothetical protein